MRRLGRNNHRIVPAMKVAGELDDLCPSAGDTADANRHQRRFGTAVREPHHLDRRNKAADPLAPFNFQFVASARMSRLCNLPLHSRDDGRSRDNCRCRHYRAGGRRRSGGPRHLRPRTTSGARSPSAGAGVISPPSPTSSASTAPRSTASCSTCHAPMTSTAGRRRTRCRHRAGAGVHFPQEDPGAGADGADGLRAAAAPRGAQ